MILGTTHYLYLGREGEGGGVASKNEGGHQKLRNKEVGGGVNNRDISGLTLEITLCAFWIPPALLGRIWTEPRAIQDDNEQHQTKIN